MAETAEVLDQEEVVQEKVEVPESVKPVGVNRVGLAEHKRNHLHVNVPHGTDHDVCLAPEFYEHFSKMLGRGDIVTIEPDDLSWEMSVRVIDMGSNWAHVKKREFYDYGGPMEVAPETPKKYKVEWAGQTHKFRVVFNGDVLKHGFATEDLARQYANNHASALKR